MRNRRLNSNLLAGFVVLCLGYIAVDLKLFYVMFFIKEPLNRVVFDTHPSSLAAMIKTFLVGLKNYFTNGYYHAASMQRKIILPVAFVLSVFLFIRFCVLAKKGKKTEGLF
jgi:hypothetical protein